MIDVWVTPFGTKKIDELPPTLRKMYSQIPRRKNGQFDRRYSKTRDWTRAVESIIQREYELDAA